MVCSYIFLLINLLVFIPYCLGNSANEFRKALKYYIPRCQGGTWQSISAPEQYETCNTLYGGLEITSTSDISNLRSLRNIITVEGLINIENTNLQDLSFFQSLKFIEYQNVGSTVLNLRNNSQMTRLGLPAPDISTVGQIQEIAFINFENLHKDFCLTVAEVVHYFELNKLSVDNFHVKLCDEEDSKYVICHAEPLKTLLNNCEVIIGNLIIEAGDEGYISKLDFTKYLFGALIIRNTNLKKIKTLFHLSLICSFEDSLPLIQIHSNVNLKEAVLGGIVNLITGGERVAIFQDNHPDLFKSKECDLFDRNNKTDFLKTLVSLTYIGGDCGDERVNITFSNASSLSIFFVISSTVFFFICLFFKI